MGVADMIGKMGAGDHIPSHAANVQQRWELLGIRNLTDQVKVLQLTIPLAVWSAWPDLVKEGKGTSEETVEELQKIINPSVAGTMVAYEIKQQREENPLIYADYGQHIAQGTGTIGVRTVKMQNSHHTITAKCEHFIDTTKL